MSIVTAFALSLVLAGQDPAPSDPSATTNPQAPAAEDRDSQRMVCRRETVVGTRFPTRVCMTRAEWDARRAESRELAQSLETRNANRGRVEAGGRAD
jgi:hypothetical protein